MIDTSPAVSPVEVVTPSLPPVSNASLAPPTKSPYPEPSMVPIPKIEYKMGKNSLVRKKAVAIVALRAAGYSTDQIAAELKIQPKSVSQYLYRATKAGFLVDRKTGSLLSDPTDKIEFELSHKVIRNLNEFMDSDDDETRKEVTLAVAQGTMFKKFDPAKEVTMPAMNVLSVRIEMPSTGQIPARAGSMGGTPSYIDGDVDGE